jgi:long-chain fatty acid transport protein
MKKNLFRSSTILSGLVLLVLTLAPPAPATNGDNIIGVGPISRSMGGVGIAAPQDAISAVFSNPASMCFGAFCPSNQVDFAGTMFMPSVKSTITLGNLTFKAHSEHRVYPIPALGISFNFPELPKWRFGFGAYGVSGMGVNYRDTAIDQPNFFMAGAPLAAGTVSDLMIMKFAPTVAYQLTDWLSMGVALHVDYSTLDLGRGNGSNFGVGAQIGIIARPKPNITLGLTYVTPQRIKYDKVADFDGDTRLDNLVLETPHNLGVGVAYEAFSGKLLLEANVKWLNWSGAKGYRDFDWRDQVVVGLGVQYKPIRPLALRLGYNYGNNPIKEHHGFDGNTLVNVQGKHLPQYYFESFRIIGFPAVVEHHLTAGIGYEITPRFIINVGYMHAFDTTVSSSGKTFGPPGFQAPVRFTSKLSEDSVDVGFSVRW